MGLNHLSVSRSSEGGAKFRTYPGKLFYFSTKGFLVEVREDGGAHMASDFSSKVEVRVPNPFIQDSSMSL